MHAFLALKVTTEKSITTKKMILYCMALIQNHELFIPSCILNFRPGAFRFSRLTLKSLVFGMTQPS